MTPELSRPELPPISFLEEMPDEVRQLLSTYGQFLPLTVGQKVITEGAAQDSLYLIVSGLLHVTREKDGVQTLLWRVTPGETIGEVNLFDPVDASADVYAQEFSQVWKVDRAELESFIKNYPVAGAQFLVAVSRLLSRRLRMMNHRFSTLQSVISSNDFWQ